MSFSGTRVLLLAIAVMGLTSAAIAQDVVGNVRSVTVIGQGEAAGPPDRASITPGYKRSRLPLLNRRSKTRPSSNGSLLR